MRQKRLLRSTTIDYLLVIVSVLIENLIHTVLLVDTDCTTCIVIDVSLYIALNFLSTT